MGPFVCASSAVPGCTGSVSSRSLDCRAAASSRAAASISCSVIASPSVCQDGFEGKGNVEIVCEQHHTPLFNTFDEFVDGVISVCI